MKKLLTTSILALASLLPAQAVICYELTVSGEWYYDIDTTSMGIGSSFSDSFTYGAAWNIGGQTYQVTAPASFTVTVVDVGTNPSSVGEPVTGAPDGLPDPIWLMEHFTLSTVVEVPDGSTVSSSWQILEGFAPGAGVTIKDLSISHTQVDCVPEPTSGLMFASLGLLGILRRRR